MKICIPHYSQLVERRAALEASLKKLGLRATWITAFDQEEITAQMIADLVDQSTLRARAAITEKVSGGKPFPQKPLKLSEVSIALKQMDILKNHSDSPDGYILVMEDDSLFRGTGFHAAFARNLEKTPDDWDLIFFGDSGIFFEKRWAVAPAGGGGGGRRLAVGRHNGR